MYAGKMVFSQLMDFLPLRRFKACVDRYNGDYKTQRFTCRDQFLCMAFAQLAFRESLRDTVSCLKAMETKLYHMGIRGSVARSTLADANENRDWRIYADFAQILINRARKLYAHDEFGVEIDNTVYALDSTTIDLCLSLFSWARFRKTKSAIKLHTLMNLRGSIPEFIHISKGKLSDVNILDLLLPQAGAFYVLDRGYLDFERLYSLHQARSFFVVRAKKNLKFKRRYSNEVDKSSGVQADQLIVLTGVKSQKRYPEILRRIRYFDKQKEKRLVFLTNNFELDALTIAELYKARWKIENFFKWIKQHLRIKSFYGTSENAVKTQIWIAVSTYILVAILKKQLNIQRSLYEILQVLSVSLFEKTLITELFTKSNYNIESVSSFKQLLLFDL